LKYEVKNIGKGYKKLKVLNDISIEFEKNKITCILGPSGCGKTTLLNIIAGIANKDSGEIIGFEKRNISFVFQEDRLFEWKNVKENIEFVLKDKMTKKDRENIIDKYLKLINLRKYKYYYPTKLSGGMRQQVNILRAFVYPSSILIMDEPFKSLDINSKQTTIEFFTKVKKLENKTCILVTHDIEEALVLGDKIVILSDKPAKIKKTITNNLSTYERKKNTEKKNQLKKLIENEIKKVEYTIPP